MAVLGMDLGGTKLAAALFDNRGHMMHRESAPLAGRQAEEVSILIVDMAQKMIQSGPVQGVGICIPGIYYAKQGTVWAPNIPGWDAYPLLETLTAALPGMPVYIDSDRACYILGETWQGTAKGCSNAIFMAIGTGIGAGILVDGRVLRGHHDIAGAIGWMGVNQPYAGKYAACGCFEYHASGDGLARVAQEYLAADPNYQGSLRQKPAAGLKGVDVFAAFVQGDTLAVRILDQAIVYWGMAVANMISTFNPEKIIFGGGVFGPAGQFLERIHAEARKWAQPISFSQVELTVSSLGGDAGLIGAGKLALGE